MKTFKRTAWLAALISTALLSPLATNAASTDDKADAAPMQMTDYLQLKRFKEIPSAGRIVESNLRQKEIIIAALNYSPTGRELLAS